ncbi:MAG: methyl-accepting chemotaxis protein [Archangium sp.]|nr:methyl-accepting chemotaxis protein [Archangium sp.]
MVAPPLKPGTLDASGGPSLLLVIPAVSLLMVASVCGAAVAAASHDPAVRQDVLTWSAVAAVVAALVGSFVLLRGVRSPLRQLALAVGRGEPPPRGGLAELDALAQASAALFAQIAELEEAIREPTRVLDQSIAGLTESSEEQTRTITRQAAALQETQVTVQEIKQTSLLAAQKAEAVLKVTERADQLGKAGDAAIEDTLQSLVAMRSEAGTIATKINELAERAKQIEGITQTVKDLADQSNMLALNAAIEAVRSGEQGKGFGVVAREIRSLADQSIEATRQVREILEDITGAIASTVSITHAGAERMESGLTRMRATGETVRELSAIVRDNSAAARQIAAAVSQQNVGISQIFTAVGDLSQMMEETVRRLDSTNASVSTIRDVSARMSQAERGRR